MLETHSILDIRCGISGVCSVLALVFRMMDKTRPMRHPHFFRGVPPMTEDGLDLPNPGLGSEA